MRVYENQSGTWTQVGEDIDGEAANDHSGYSVSISGDGSIVAIGADGNDGNGSDSGHVRVYENQSGTWTQVGEDINGEAEYDNSGWSVSISDDGSTVAIGAYYNDGGGNRAGHVRVYDYGSDAWTQVGDDIDGEAADDQSGYSVSISYDGSTVAIGAIYNDGSATNAGHVRVYEYGSGAWTQIGEDIDGEAAEDNCGWSVSISGDGGMVAIGAPSNDGNGTNAGEAYFFTSSAGTALANDTDAEDDDLTADEVTGPQHAESFTLNDDGSFTYVHDGGEDTTDSFTYRVYDGTAYSDPVTVTITITPVNDPPELTNNGVSLMKETTVTITGTHLQAADADNGADELVYTVGTAPSAGTLKRDATALGGSGTFTQNDIDQDLLTYTHDGNTATSDSFTFDLSVGEDGITGQTFAIAIIHNEPPEADDIESETLAFSENGSAQAVTATITLSDPESDDITGAAIAITGSFQAGSDVLAFPGYNGITVDTWDPQTGVLTLTGTASLADYQAALRLVTYQSTSDDPSSPKTVSFTVTDEFGESTAANRTIAVTAVNDPPLAANSGAAVDEGAGVTITTAMLNETDPDDSGAGLTYTVTAVPVNGELKLDGTPLSQDGTFTQADIDGGLIAYEHDDSETTADGFTFDLADGGEDGAAALTGQTFTITVELINDNEPVVSPNTGNTLNEGGSCTVSADTLETTDPDVDQTAGGLIYTVTAAPSLGTLYRGGSALEESGTFSQDDIDNNLVSYAHGHGELAYDDTEGVFKDSFGFNVTDTPSEGGGAPSGNLLTDPGFEDPYTYWTRDGSAFFWQPNGGEGSTFGAALESYTSPNPVTGSIYQTVEATPGTTYILDFRAFFGEDWDATSMYYKLLALDESQQPIDYHQYFDFHVPFPSEQWVSVSSFIQQVSREYTAPAGTAYMKVIIGVDDGSGTTAMAYFDNVELVAVSGVGHEVTGQTYALDITPLNDNAPQVSTNEGATVDEGAAATVTSAMLWFDDGDVHQTDADLVYTVTGLPQHGTLKVDGAALAQNGTFTQDDIGLGLLTYLHDGGETTSDSFTFDLGDGEAAHDVTGQTFAITVNPVNDPPVLSGIETTSPTFVADMDPVQVTVSLIIEDVDSTNFSSAEVTITGNYHGDQDVLAFAGYQNITGQFSAGTGSLTLSGYGGLTDWQAAFRLVTYESTAQPATEDARTVSFTLNDYPDTSNVVSRDITVINDIWPPVIVSGGVAVYDNDQPGTTGYGYPDRLVITYDEPLEPGMEDFGDWIILDADGVTDLLAGLDNTSLTISGNTLIITLSDDKGSLDDPFYMYREDGDEYAIQDPYGNEKVDVNNNTPPAAYAGADQESVPAVFTLDATAVNGSLKSYDPDGNVITYLWEQTGGPSIVEFLDAGAQVDPLYAIYNSTEDAVTKFIARAHGEYEFELTVTDPFGAYNTDTMTVTVLNVVPVAKAGRDRSLMRDEDDDLDVTLDGSASIDANRHYSDQTDPELEMIKDIVSYQWEQVGGPVFGVTLEAAPGDPDNPAKAAFDTSTLPGGTYGFQLTAADGGDGGDPTPLSGTGTVNITVNVPDDNIPPTAHAGVNIDQYVSSMVTLTGHESKDTDGDTLTFRWSQVENGAPVVPFIGGTSATSVQPKFKPTRPGAYIFELVVNDGTVDSVPDRVEVYILKQAAEFPIADILIEGVRTSKVPLPISVGDTLVLDGEVLGVADPNTVTARWSQTDGPTYTIADAALFEQTFTPVNEGVYTFRLDVFTYYDTSQQLQGRYAELTVTVVDDTSHPPAADAGADQEVLVDTLVTLDGSGEDEDPGDEAGLEYTWTQTLGPNVPLSDSAVLSPTFTPKRTGVYCFELVAFDGTFESVADAVHITVNSPTQSVPQAVVSEDEIDTMVGSLVIMDGLPSFDPDTGDADTDDPEDSGEWNLVYQWEKVSGPPAVLDDLNSPQPSFYPSTVGTYVFKLYVDDRGNDLSMSATVTVTVGQAGAGGGEADHSETGPGGGSCFIATAAYGTPFEEEVVTLRQFRDRVLLPTGAGTKLVGLYYRYSPPLAAAISRDGNLRRLTRHLLAPAVRLIRIVSLAPGTSGPSPTDETMLPGYGPDPGAAGRPLTRQKSRTRQERGDQ